LHTQTKYINCNDNRTENPKASRKHNQTVKKNKHNNNEKIVDKFLFYFFIDLNWKMAVLGINKWFEI